MVDVLIGIGNNHQEWNDSLKYSNNRPRLPLPYNFGTAFYQNGYCLSAINFSSYSTKISSQPPFKSIYNQREMLTAMKAVDVVLLWASQGIKATLQQALLSPPQKKVILASYVWDLNTLPNAHRKLGIATHCAAPFTKALVLMTSEQQKMACQRFPSIPIIKLTCGIDTKFYQHHSDWSDVPESERKIVESLLTSPYAIMPGDEQRCNSDALDILTNSNLKLVRISQYTKDKDAKWFKQQIHEKGLTDRCFFFERISYPFLRFLMQNATVYAGLVNSKWQPAGWTVACEALASGLPVVLYEGLVSNELDSLGAGKFISTVPMGDTKTFQMKLESILSEDKSAEINQQIQIFTATQLDLEKTGALFAKEIAHTLS